MTTIISAPAPDDDRESPPFSDAQPSTGTAPGRPAGSLPVAPQVGGFTGPGTQPDPFVNFQRLLLAQDFSGGPGIKLMSTTTAVHKANRLEFVQARPGANWRFDTVCQNYLIVGSYNGPRSKTNLTTIP